ncbi:MAG: HAD-IIIC family phosphatase [Clostridia bacterium]|nr:HAD-IIIC family phosphatase [Clostridia bacterium]
MNQDQILACLAETLKKDPEELQKLDPDASLSTVGMTSLSFISFIVKVESEYNIEVLDSDLIFENFETVNKLFQTLSKYFPSETPIKKVLVLDADNVLWKGISGEEPLLLDDNVLMFQNTLLELYNRGVLLCLCSKNRPELIEQAFALPEMQLKKEHFAVFLANRTDKATNLRAIEEELNLSSDSYVFVDDSDYELGYVQLNIPKVECIKMEYPTPNSFFERLSSLFASVQATTDLNRTQLYREQKEREKEKKAFTSIQAYNASLKTVPICRKACTKDCARLAELSVRTHQFNLSAVGYTEEMLKKLLEDPDHVVFSLSVSDKYGDMGIVGMAVLYRKTIEAFMLSCRVFDRDLELVLLDEIKACAGEVLYGVYRENDKNRQFANFYSNNGVFTV